MLAIYGQRHHGYGVTKDMLDLMGESFVVSIKAALEEDWNKDIEAAWSQLFTFMSYYMKLAYPKEAITQSPPQEEVVEANNMAKFRARLSLRNKKH